MRGAGKVQADGEVTGRWRRTPTHAEIPHCEEGHCLEVRTAAPDAARGEDRLQGVEWPPGGLATAVQAPPGTLWATQVVHGQAAWSTPQARQAERWWHLWITGWDGAAHRLTPRPLRTRRECAERLAPLLEAPPTQRLRSAGELLLAQASNERRQAAGGGVGADLREARAERLEAEGRALAEDGTAAQGTGTQTLVEVQVARGPWIRHRVGREPACIGKETGGLHLARVSVHPAAGAPAELWSEDRRGRRRSSTRTRRASRWSTLLRHGWTLWARTADQDGQEG